MPETRAPDARPRPSTGVLWPNVFIDVEASSLEVGTFPIEVGICGDDLVPESWLVRPHPTWRRAAWSRDSEAIHGIGLHELDAHGLDAAQVVGKILERVAGRPVHSDSLPWDGHWLGMLFEAAGTTMPFVLAEEAEAYACLAPRDAAEAQEVLHRWRAASLRCQRVYPTTHRAGADALSMAATFRMTCDPDFAAEMLAYPL